MRIGVNALYMIPGGVGGTEIYLRNLLKALAAIDAANEYFVFTNRETGRALAPDSLNFHHVPQPVAAVNRPWRIIWEQTGLPVAARRLGIECMFNAGFTAPAWAACPNVTVFHDFQHRRHPENFSAIDIWAWRFFLNIALRRSRILIAVSETTREDLAHYYPQVTDRIRVAPHGVEREFFAIAERRCPEPFVLCVSTLHPHKNLDRLIRVFRKFRERRPEYRLVLAGMRGFHAAEIEGMADEHVQITGWIPREELYELYRRAAFFVYPSKFEGFGMPVLEAMAAGVPLACSSIEPLRSLAESAALQFSPDDEIAMLATFERLVNDPKLAEGLVAAGQRRAREFTWERSARITLDAIESVRS